MRSAVAMLLLVGCSGTSADDGRSRDASESEDASVIDPGSLDDEFEDPSTLSAWTLLDSSLHQLLDISTTTAGRLTIIPRANAAWYEDLKGPFLFKMVSGNFAVRTAVVAGNTTNPDVAPLFDFNSAGFVVRDPASQEGGGENWLMFNVGRQDGRVGSEGKTTVDSRSTLFITEGSHRGELILCRIGARFLMLRKLEGESSFSETHRFDRPDLPTTLQVGPIASAYVSTTDLRALFDYVRFKTPDDEADCE